MLKIPEAGKLIDAGHLYRYADGEYHAAKVKYGDCEFTRFAENVRDIIGEMAYDLPAVDAVEVVHGKWVWKDGCFHCTNCKATEDHITKFCHNCGVKMK